MGSDIVEAIKSALDCPDVISNYVSLTKRGKVYLGRCPFHGDGDPSLAVYPGDGGWYCYGCHLGGDLFTFLQEAEGMSFQQALAALAAMAGIEVPRFRRQRDHEERVQFTQKRLKLRVAPYVTLVLPGTSLEGLEGYPVGALPSAPPSWVQASDIRRQTRGEDDISRVLLLYDCARRPEALDCLAALYHRTVWFNVRVFELDDVTERQAVFRDMADELWRKSTEGLGVFVEARGVNALCRVRPDDVLWHASMLKHWPLDQRKIRVGSVTDLAAVPGLDAPPPVPRA